MTLTRIAHRNEFKKVRRQLPSLVGFFRTEDGEPVRWAAPQRYKVNGLLGARESPVSGEAFKYWLYAYVQRQAGVLVERRLPFMERRTAPYPDDADGLVTRSLPFRFDRYSVELDRYRDLYSAYGAQDAGAADVAALLPDETGAAFGEESRTDNDGGTSGAAGVSEIPSADDEMNAYVVTQLPEALRRRFDYISGDGRAEIVRDCARLAELDAFYQAKPLLRTEFFEDTYDRIAVDLGHMIEGVLEHDWSSASGIGVHERLPLGIALGYPDAAIDIRLDDRLIEIKPVRHVAEEGACDQLLAYYLLHAVAYPQRPIRELRLYLARHASFAVASVEEIAEQFPLWQFGDLLFTAERAYINAILEQTFEEYCWIQRETAANRAWEMTDLIFSIGRRLERAGRIGVTRLGETREAPHIVETDLLNEEDHELSIRVQRALKDVRLETMWENAYEKRREDLRKQDVELSMASDIWRDFLERQGPQASRLG
ncbi:MAG: hypothetical protein ACYCVB_16765 [Bacilli bacterium]